MTTRNGIWLLPLETWELSDQEVHVWRATLNSSLPRIQELENLLSDDEIERSKRFRFVRDRERFIIARGLLRTILGRYLGTQPDTLKFRYVCVCGDPQCSITQQKPALAGEFCEDTLRFNLSHSGGLVLYGVTRGRELGIDIERVRPDEINIEIAQHFFSRGEINALLTLPLHLRQQAFYACWTRKEAYIKARGGGMSLPLDQFEVTMAPDEPVVLLSVENKRAEHLQWSLCDLHPDPDYAAALVVEGQVSHIRCWQWVE